jgi:hypothetical protein
LYYVLSLTLRSCPTSLDKTLAPTLISSTIFLSSYLHISEPLSLSLLTSASSQPSFNHGRTPIETSIKLFHDLISLRLDCLKWILGAPTSLVFFQQQGQGSGLEMSATKTILESAFEEVYTLKRFEIETSSTINGDVKGGGGGTGGGKISVEAFPDGIFKQLSLLSQWIDETLPNTGKRLPETTKLQPDVQALRIQGCRSHMRGLAKCLYEVGASGGLVGNHLLALVKWLKVREVLDGTTVMMIRYVGKKRIFSYSLDLFRGRRLVVLGKGMVS